MPKGQSSTTRRTVQIGLFLKKALSGRVSLFGVTSPAWQSTLLKEVLFGQLQGSFPGRLGKCSAMLALHFRWSLLAETLVKAELVAELARCSLCTCRRQSTRAPPERLAFWWSCVPAPAGFAASEPASAFLQRPPARSPLAIAMVIHLCVMLYFFRPRCLSFGHIAPKPALSTLSYHT